MSAPGLVNSNRFSKDYRVTLYFDWSPLISFPIGMFPTTFTLGSTTAPTPAVAETAESPP